MSERLLGDALLLLERHRCQRAHVVQPVGELDDQHPQVLGHRHQHLAHAGGLLLLTRVETDALELGDTIDDGCDLGAEVALDIGDGDLGVLDGVVQQRSGHRDLVEADVGDDLRDRERMVDVALTARTHLRLVRVGGHAVRAADRRDRGLRMTAPVRRQQRCQLGIGGLDMLAPPWEHTVDGPHGAAQ